MNPSARFIRTVILLSLFATVGLDGTLEATETMTKLRARLERETKPAERARIVAKLAPLELDEVAAAYRDGQLDQGATRLAKLVEVVEQADRGLQTMPVNPRRKSKGFKELEIAVRESIRRLHDVATSVSYPNREPIEAAIGRLEKVRDNLLSALFESPKTDKSNKGP